MPPCSPLAFMILSTIEPLSPCEAQKSRESRPKPEVDPHWGAVVVGVVRAILRSGVSCAPNRSRRPRSTEVERQAGVGGARFRHAAGATRRRRRRRITSRSIEVRASSSAVAGSSPRSRSTSRRSARAPSRSSPRSPRPTPQDVDDAVKAAREAYDKYWSKMRAAGAREVPLPHRARDPGERRASSRSSSRWTAASRSRSRATSTCPLAAAHFFYHAGWADKLDYAFPGPASRPLGVAGQIIPWNFPLLMLGVEDRAGARVRKHRRASSRPRRRR